MPSYQGPIRDEPLSVELHNTIYAVSGDAVDGLADAPGLRAWLVALGHKLPLGATSVDTRRLQDFQAVRASVREALHATVERRAISESALAHLNDLSARSPISRELTQRGASRTGKVRYHATTPTDVALGIIASETIALLTGPDADNLRRCGAPGCVLMFLKNHPRREWCSGACGNRARQARHYARSRGRGRA